MSWTCGCGQPNDDDDAECANCGKGRGAVVDGDDD